MQYRDMTRAQRRRLRELAAVAYERELGAELSKLEAEFARWRSGELDAFELSERIHAFHKGPARKLYTKYGVKPDFTVAAAIASGTIPESEAGPEVVALLEQQLAFYRADRG